MKDIPLGDFARALAMIVAQLPEGAEFHIQLSREDEDMRGNNPDMVFVSWGVYKRREGERNAFDSYDFHGWGLSSEGTLGSLVAVADTWGIDLPLR